MPLLVTRLQNQAIKVGTFKLLGIIVLEQVGHVMFKTSCIVAVLNLYMF